MLVEKRQIGSRGERNRATFEDVRRTAGAEELVSHNLHGHCKIERQIALVRWNADQKMRDFEMLVGETRALGAKEERHGCIRSLRHEALCCLPRIDDAKILVAMPRGGGGNESAALNGSGQSINHARAREHIIGARGARHGIRVREELGPHEHELGERHVLHGARAGADIARMRGFNKDYADQRMLSSGCMQPLLNIAVRAARRAGEIIVRSMSRLDSLQIASKGRNDFVTEVDHAAEREIIAVIHKAHPNHAILAEESGASGEDDTLWIIDPLDGTTNFVHGNPVFCVSIACQHKGKLEHAVIYDPLRQELFTASNGGGAHLDNHRMRVTQQRTLDGALIATGFPYRSNTRYIDAYMGMLKTVMMKSAGVRRGGSAALDLAYVAAGRVDAFWEIGLSPWDTAAGTLLIQEAGGRIGTMTGEIYTQKGNIVAGAPRVYTALLAALARHVPKDLREE
jgi:myo-inositol-1(or 4)-monophosphatase